MRIIDADPTRMIDLPGAGPCPRPVDIDQSVTGFARLKSLRIYRFAPDVTIEGESEVDEVYIVPLDGAVTMAISGTHPLDALLSATGDRALYMTPHHAYRLLPQVTTQVAYARAAASGAVPVHVVPGAVGDRAEHLRMTLADLVTGDVLATDAGRERLVHVVAGVVDADGQPLAAGQTLALATGETVRIVATGAVSVLMISA